MGKLTLVARILAKPEMRNQVKAELVKLIEPTRAEAGCINYDLHQDNKNENQFFFHENWASYEEWQAHMVTSHILEYVDFAQTAVEEFEVAELTQI